MQATELQEEKQAEPPLKRVKVEQQVEEDPPPNPADWSHPANWIDPVEALSSAGVRKELLTWLEVKSEEQTADAAPPPVPEADNPAWRVQASWRKWKRGCGGPDWMPPRTHVPPLQLLRGKAGAPTPPLPADARSPPSPMTADETSPADEASPAPPMPPVSVRRAY